MIKHRKNIVKIHSCYSKVKNLSFSLDIFAACLVLFTFWVCGSCFAQEITILFTGQTHAMLYPCNCPSESDGGLSRRAALIKEIRKNYPDALVLDSGGFFAGGLLDEYTQNTQLDMQRTAINLKAMKLMNYDALTLGPDEFYFGKEFLGELIDKTKMNFLSCNVVSGGLSEPANFLQESGKIQRLRDKSLIGKKNNLKPYLIKEVSGIKIGIIGVTNVLAMQKASGIKFIEPKIAVAKYVSYLKKNGVNIIILLSNQNENQDLNLISEIAGIDILIGGYSDEKKQFSTKIDNTLVFRPVWQGRRLGKVTLAVKDNKIVNYKAEELRLSDKIAEDAGILSILPNCFLDINCKKDGLAGVCENPGSINARCLFSEPDKISLLVITTKDCSVCDTETVINFLKKRFPGLVTSYLYYPGKKADTLVDNFAITALPAYLFAKEIEKEKDFDTFKGNLEKKSDFYMLKPEFGGISYFINRKKIKGKLDLFFSLYEKNSLELFEVTKEFNPDIHFLAAEQQGEFNAIHGNYEIEEYLRAVCVKKYFPQHFSDYIGCRLKFINSSWWQDCLVNEDTDKIKTCAKGNEGRELLKENITLNKELNVMSGPTYLMDNQEIFGLQGVPTKEKLKKVLRK